MTDHQTLLELVQKGLNGEESVDEVVRRLNGLAIGLGQELDDQTALELAQQLVPTDDPPPPPDAPPPPPDSPGPAAEEVALPKLIVDWGTYPQLGQAASPQFILLCPDAYQREQPTVLVKVAENLDHTVPVDRPRILKSEGPGLWGFYVPFTLTTNDQDCRPGHYVILVTVEYHNLTNPNLPHAFHCTIRLDIKQPSDNEERTLEIHGDGKSIINLRGLDAESYGRLVVKASDRANIIVHKNPLLQSEEADEQTEEESVTYTFELKPTLAASDYQGPPPHIPADFKKASPIRMKTAMFVFADESRRILLIPMKRVTVGRNRNAQIVLRFLPRSEEHDRLSLKISRDHMTLELTSDGLLVKDRGVDRQGKQTGAVYIASTTIKDGEGHLLGPDQIGGPLPMEVPDGLSLGNDQPFKFDLELFGSGGNDPGYDKRTVKRELQLLRQAIGARGAPLLWRIAEKNGFDAVRLRRSMNLAEEEYVLLYCRGLIGNSPSSNPIHIDDHGLSAGAARLVYVDNSFWLQNLGPAERVQVNERPIAPGELIPLSPGMELLFGETAVRFERFEQMHL